MERQTGVVVVPNFVRAMFSLLFKVVWLYLINWLNKLQPLSVDRFRGACTILAVEEDGSVSPQTEHTDRLQEFIVSACESSEDTILFSGRQPRTTFQNKWTNLADRPGNVLVQIGCNNTPEYSPLGVCGVFFWRAVITQNQIQEITQQGKSVAWRINGEIRGLPTSSTMYAATLHVMALNKNLIVITGIELEVPSGVYAKWVEYQMR